MLRWVHPGGLQDIEKPHQIALHVGLWVADAVPDVSLGTQVHHVIGANLRPKALESARFSEIELHEPEIIQPLKLDDVKDALKAEGVAGITVLKPAPW